MRDKTFNHASFLDHLSAARINLDLAERRYAELVEGPMDEVRFEQMCEALIGAGMSASWAAGRASDDLAALAALSGEELPGGIPAVLEAAADVLPDEEDQ